MENVTIIALIGTLIGIVTLMIKKHSPELAFLLSVSTVLCIVMVGVKLLFAIDNLIGVAQQLSGLPTSLFVPVIKCVCICITTKIGAELCRDASESGLAVAIEFAGSVGALAVSIPLFDSVISLLGDFL